MTSEPPAVAATAQTFSRETRPVITSQWRDLGPITAHEGNWRLALQCTSNRPLDGSACHRSVPQTYSPFPSCHRTESANSTPAFLSPNLLWRAQSGRARITPRGPHDGPHWAAGPPFPYNLRDYSRSAHKLPPRRAHAAIILSTLCHDAPGHALNGPRNPTAKPTSILPLSFSAKVRHM